MRILNIYRLSLILLFILAFGAGLATFLENFYDTQTARVLVYEALWYECVMFACTICLAISIVKTKMYKIWRIFDTSCFYRYLHRGCTYKVFWRRGRYAS